MAHGYVKGFDLDQAELVPATPRERLPAGHVAWFIDDVVAALDTSAFHSRRRLGGRGRAGYDPDRLLAVLLYGYCQGVRSSRRIEALCEVDIAFQVLARGVAPDHSTLARFRTGHERAIEDLFVQVLMLCAQEGMTRLGVVALDGTKIAADASPAGNRTEATLRAEVEAILAEAAETDAGEDRLFGDARGDELPDRLAPKRGRVERLRACLADIEACHREPKGAAGARRRVARAETTVVREQQRRQQWLAQRRRREAEAAAQGRRLATPPLVDEPPKLRRAREQLVRAQAHLAEVLAQPRTTHRGQPPRRNPTDPDSRLMKSQGQWVQGYNAQAVVNEDGVIVAADVANGPDQDLFIPMISLLAASRERAGLDEQVGTVLADAGYWSKDNATHPGPDRLIATCNPRNTDPATQRCEHRQDMTQRLEQPDAAACYAKRKHIVEPAFGRIKGPARRIDRFQVRGLAKVKTEWLMICLTENLLTLHRRARPA